MATRNVATNRKARHEYFVDNSYEAGIELRGCEVKSLRTANVSLNEAHAQIADGEVWVHGMHISSYKNTAGADAPDPVRKRRLLLKKREIERLDRQVRQKGYTLIPLRVYFNERGYAKMELGLCRGKRQYDKRQTIAERDIEREAERTRREFEKMGG
jgi:SsrA-binding protein